MKVIIRLSNGQEITYKTALDCKLENGFLHVVVKCKGHGLPKTYSYNKDNIDEYETYTGHDESK